MEPAPTVVLVPGLWVPAELMRPMGARIARCGYRVRRFSYASVRATLDENADALAEFCAGEPALNLVGHSLGGIVIVRAMARAPALAVRRAVLLGTPFADCHAARRFSRLPGGTALLGKSIRQWLDGAGREAPARGELGVIAGDLSLGLGRLVAPDLPRPNDGVVTVAETHVPGMRDHIVLPVSHTAMLFSARVARAACRFVRHGRFAAAAS